MRWLLAPDRRVLTLVAALLLGASFIAFATGFWLLFRLAYLIALGIPIAWLIAWHGSRGIEVSADRRSDRAQAGQEALEILEVRNRGVLPRFWVEAEDPSELPGHRSRRVILLPPRRSRNWIVTTKLTRRGVFRWGPARITSTDPWGLFRRVREFGHSQEIMVFPQVVDIPHFQAPPANLPGEGRFRRRTHQVTPNASGIREYEPGDSLTRIHWRTTARIGKLMVKTFELDPASDIWVVLDMERRPQAGSGDESTEEYAVRVAASVTRHYLVQNRSVGLITFARDLRVVEPERGPQHLNRILETLATVRAVGDAPLANILMEEQRRFGRHTTLVVVTPATDETWVTPLLSLSQRGVRVAVVLVDPSSFGSDRSPLLLYGQLAASDVLTYVVRSGDELSVALSPTAGSGVPAWQA